MLNLLAKFLFIFVTYYYFMNKFPFNKIKKKNKQYVNNKRQRANRTKFKILCNNNKKIERRQIHKDYCSDWNGTL